MNDNLLRQIMVGKGLMELYSTSEPGCFRLGGRAAHWYIGTFPHWYINQHINTLTHQHINPQSNQNPHLRARFFLNWQRRSRKQIRVWRLPFALFCRHC